MDKKSIRLTGRLYFNNQNGRCGILNSDDLWSYEGLHCGELIEWYNSETGIWVDDRFEGTYPGDKPQCWYLAASGLKGMDLDNLQVPMRYS
jgi:hypothetical protein